MMFEKISKNETTLAKIVISAESEFLPIQHLCESAKAEMYKHFSFIYGEDKSFNPWHYRFQEFLWALYLRLKQNSSVRKSSIEIVSHYLKPIKKKYKFYDPFNANFCTYFLFDDNYNGVINLVDNYDDFGTYEYFIGMNADSVLSDFEDVYLAQKIGLNTIHKGWRGLIELEKDLGDV